MNSAQCYVAVWMGQEFGDNGHMYVAEFLRFKLETITTLLVSYIPMQNKSVLKVNSGTSLLII